MERTLARYLGLLLIPETGQHHCFFRMIVEYLIITCSKRKLSQETGMSERKNLFYDNVKSLRALGQFGLWSKSDVLEETRSQP